MTPLLLFLAAATASSSSLRSPCTSSVGISRAVRHSSGSSVVYSFRLHADGTRWRRRRSGACFKTAAAGGNATAAIELQLIQVAINALHSKLHIYTAIIHTHRSYVDWLRSDFLLSHLTRLRYFILREPQNTSRYIHTYDDLQTELTKYPISASPRNHGGCEL